MSVFLTKEQLSEIRELQTKLDERIKKEKGLEETDLSLEKHIAIKTELFEFINEIEGFKWWKEHKGKPNIVKEACDTLHFAMSLAIDNDVEILSPDNEENYNKNNYDLNGLCVTLDFMLNDMYIERDYIGLTHFITLMCIVLDLCGYSADDLYNAYIEKNKENHKRQDNKY